MIKLIITDLDDTLYSWIGFFVPAFYDMAREVSKILDVPEKQLLAEYRQVHQRVGSLEFPHATLLLPSVQKQCGHMTAGQQKKYLDSAFHAFNATRKKLLVLYPGVKETFELLAEQGIRIVGYTESAEENGFYRLKKLGMDRYFEKVYVSDSSYQRPDYIPSSPKTIIVQGKKPNPGLIEQICKNESVSLSETLYMGDSLSKDILMAKQVGVRSVWVKVSETDPGLYDKLVTISHWTKEDFERDERNRCLWKENGYTPDFTIESFNDLPAIVLSLS